MALNEEQREALDKIHAWRGTPGTPFFVLGGSAGTGKTYTCQELLRESRAHVCFTAPTNKAVKVLRATMGDATDRCDFATTYSLLGLRMVADGKVKVIRAKNANNRVQDYDLVVIDEGSMVNTILMEHITEAAYNHRGTKFLFMGDPAQLPPVKEETSPIWELVANGTAQAAMLTKVMRHDNQILTVCTGIREKVYDLESKLRIVQDFDTLGGVRVMQPEDFEKSIRQHAKFRESGFRDGTSKVIAWTNRTVMAHNDAIRDIIWGGNAQERYLFDERVVFAAPVLDADEIPVAHTDDEGRVVSAILTTHPDYDFPVLEVQVELDDDSGKTVMAWVLDYAAQQEFNAELEELALQAKRHPYKWQEFWKMKDAFHDLRYGYALTAHRAQGSTYKNVFVNGRNILSNRNKQEAYRALYVACSRPTTNLIIG